MQNLITDITYHDQIQWELHILKAGEFVIPAMS